jgi:hypothetical protein
MWTFTCLWKQRFGLLPNLTKPNLTPPILSHPNYQLPFEIHTDASGYGIEAILVEQHEEEERAISYVSRLLSSAKLNYSVSEKERSTLMSMRTPFVG